MDRKDADRTCGGMNPPEIEPYSEISFAMPSHPVLSIGFRETIDGVYHETTRGLFFIRFVFVDILFQKLLYLLPRTPRMYAIECSTVFECRASLRPFLEDLVIVHVQGEI